MLDVQRGKLGKGKKVTIPSCVVTKIREHFQEQCGQYIGFRTAFDSMQDLCSVINKYFFKIEYTCDLIILCNSNNN